MEKLRIHAVSVIYTVWSRLNICRFYFYFKLNWFVKNIQSFDLDRMTQITLIVWIYDSLTTVRNSKWVTGDYFFLQMMIIQNYNNSFKIIIIIMVTINKSSIKKSKIKPLHKFTRPKWQNRQLHAFLTSLSLSVSFAIADFSFPHTHELCLTLTHSHPLTDLSFISSLWLVPWRKKRGILRVSEQRRVISCLRCPFQNFKIYIYIFESMEQ